MRWTTHEPKGLSAKDVELAAMCDQLARDFGELPASEMPQPAASTTTAQTESPSSDDISCEIRGLADRVASGAGDCCVPKSKKPAAAAT